MPVPLRNRHFDGIAFAYDRLLGPPQIDALADLLALPVPGWLLDAGGGTGRASAPLRSLVDGVVVADLSLPMLRQVRRKEGMTGLQATAEALPFVDGTFERVIVVDAFHHFADQWGALGELVRVLKPGGRLLVEEPDVTRWPVKGVAVLEKLLLMESHFIAPELLARALVDTGLKPLPIRRGGHFRAWIAAEKPL